MDLTTQFATPEEKLWLVVRDYKGGVQKIGPQSKVIEKELPGWTDGLVKLEKNSVIKLGRVRLRVRNIDYANDKYECVESMSDNNVLKTKKESPQKNETYTDK